MAKLFTILLFLGIFSALNCGISLDLEDYKTTHLVTSRLGVLRVVYHKDNQQIGGICSGTVVHPHFILTAGHCW